MSLSMVHIEHIILKYVLLKNYDNIKWNIANSHKQTLVFIIHKIKTIWITSNRHSTKANYVPKLT